jgi:gliding motility-associated-like protein
VNSDILFFAPNSFTPDDDEFNQTWEFAISGIDEYNFELMIFDRWGEILWETHDIHASWDGTYHGKILPAGTYTWVARVKDVYSDDKKVFNGSIYMNR